MSISSASRRYSPIMQETTALNKRPRISTSSSRRMSPTTSVAFAPTTPPTKPPAIPTAVPTPGATAVPAAPAILAAAIPATIAPPAPPAIDPSKTVMFFVYCAVEIFLDARLYVSGIENTAKVKADVITLLLKILARCFEAAAP